MLKQLLIFFTATALLTDGYKKLIFRGRKGMNVEFNEGSVDGCETMEDYEQVMQLVFDQDKPGKISTDADAPTHLTSSIDDMDMEINTLAVACPCTQNVFGLEKEQHQKMLTLFHEQVKLADEVLADDVQQSPRQMFYFDWLVALSTRADNTKQTEHLMVAAFLLPFDNDIDLSMYSCLFLNRADPFSPMFTCQASENEVMEISVSATGKMLQQPRY